VAYSNSSHTGIRPKVRWTGFAPVTFCVTISNIAPTPGSSFPSRHTTYVISKMVANNRRATNKGTHNKATKPLDTSVAATCECPVTATVFHSLSPCQSFPECQHPTVKRTIGQNPKGSSHYSVSIQPSPNTVCTVYIAHMDTAPTY